MAQEGAGGLFRGIVPCMVGILPYAGGGPALLAPPTAAPTMRRPARSGVPTEGARFSQGRNTSGGHAYFCLGSLWRPRWCGAPRVKLAGICMQSAEVPVATLDKLIE